MVEVLRGEDYKLVPQVYALGFDDEAWNQSWYQIPLFNPNSTFSYKIDGELVGFIVSFLDKNMKPYISLLTTVPTERKRGIGSALLETAFDYWRRRGYGSIYIHVDKKRQDAYKLYIKWGFEVEVEEDKDYFMKKRL